MKKKGTLIDRRTVLTAAHCLPNVAYTTKVYLGFQDISKIGTANMAPGIEVSVTSVIPVICFFAVYINS